MQNRGESSVNLLLVLVNSLVILVCAGLLFYTKMVFKRPRITEETERARIAALRARPTPVPTPGLVAFDPITVNIDPAITSAPGIPPTSGVPAKLRYVNLAFSLELRDFGRRDQIEELKPLILDGVISMLGHRSFAQLTTVQGRYVVREQIIEICNQLVKQRYAKSAALNEGLVTNVFFNQFVAQ